MRSEPRSSPLCAAHPRELLINFAPTGMVPTKADNPAVPVSPAEVIDEVLEAHARGITIVHLHARDAEQRPTYCRRTYGKIIEGIRKHARDLIICVSLSGRDFPEYEFRSDPLKLLGDLRPDMGSLTLSSLNFSRQASLNAPDLIQRLAEEMGQRGILPELEAFDLGMLNYANYLIRKGVVRTPTYTNLILGNIAGAQCDPLQLGTMLQSLPPDGLWAVGGIGRAQLPAVAMSIAAGGGVRIGLEDNLLLHGRKTNNQELLGVVHQLATLHARPLMTSNTARKHLGMDQYGSSTISNHGGWQGRKVA